jgi:hypothetical protein
MSWKRKIIYFTDFNGLSRMEDSEPARLIALAIFPYYHEEIL